MPIYRRAFKKPLNEFATMIAPDRIEEAFERVADYYIEGLHLSFDTPSGVAGVLDDLIHQNGEPVREALNTLLCDPQNATHKSVEDSLRTGGVKSALDVLMPHLEEQYRLAPAVALLVATMVIKTVAAQGEKAVCEELTQQHRKAVRGIRHAVKKKAEVAARAKSRKSVSRPTRKVSTPPKDSTAQLPGAGRRKQAVRPKAPSKASQ